MSVFLSHSRGHSQIYIHMSGTVLALVWQGFQQTAKLKDLFTVVAGTTTDSSGTYTVTVPSGTYEVTADMDRYLDSAYANVVVVDNASDDGSHGNTTVLALNSTAALERFGLSLDPTEGVEHAERLGDT